MEFEFYEFRKTKFNPGLDDIGDHSHSTDSTKDTNCNQKDFSHHILLFSL